MKPTGKLRDTSNFGEPCHLPVFSICGESFCSFALYSRVLGTAYFVSFFLCSPYNRAGL
jgi:hypothetical protein